MIPRPRAGCAISRARSRTTRPRTDGRRSSSCTSASGGSFGGSSPACPCGGDGRGQPPGTSKAQVRHRACAHGARRRCLSRGGLDRRDGVPARAPVELRRPLHMLRLREHPLTVRCSSRSLAQNRPPEIGPKWTRSAAAIDLGEQFEFWRPCFADVASELPRGPPTGGAGELDAGARPARTGDDDGSRFRVVDRRSSSAANVSVGRTRVVLEGDEVNVGQPCLGGQQPVGSGQMRAPRSETPQRPRSGAAAARSEATRGWGSQAPRCSTGGHFLMLSQRPLRRRRCRDDPIRRVFAPAANCKGVVDSA